MKYYDDDNLLIDDIGEWALLKYGLIAQYSRMFATSMRDSWECRVYIDLFCSCGFGRIKSTSKIVGCSPILALDIPDQFDKYIFCDVDEEKIDSLRKRVERLFPNTVAEHLCLDVNNDVEKILDSIPSHSRSNKVISFCLLDPYRIDNLSFATIQQLSKKIMDFLVLSPSFMDANRNVLSYFRNNNNKVERFLGDQNWRTDWQRAKDRGLKFGNFMVLKFNEQMCNLGFLCLKPHEFVLVRHTGKNAPLYHLAFYSKHPLGKHFWNEARRGSSQQLNIFDL